MYDKGRKRPYTFVNFANEPWHTPWLTHQPLMAEMSRAHDVLFYLREFTLDDVFSNLKTGSLPRSGLEQVMPRVYQMRPSKFYPKVYFSGTFDQFMAGRRAGEIRRFLDAQGWENRVAYVWNPRYKDFLGRLDERLTVFHCHDHYPDFFAEGSEERAEVARQYEELIDRADVVFACSDALYRDVLKKRTQDVYLVENAVDFASFRAAAESEDGVAPEMRRLPRPVVGYIGRINRTVDIDAMIRMADARKDWSVLLMGPKTGWSDACERRFQQFLRRPNAHYLPGRPPQELPRYMNGLDVGLMNYNKEGTWVSYGFPLKMFEYFSLGLPVVGTDLPSIRKYAPLVHIVPDGGDWTEAVEKALAQKGSPLAAERVELARRNSWSERCAFIEGILDAKLAGKREEELCPVPS